MKRHIPVLSKEVIELVEPRIGDIIIDATVGLGGHTESLVQMIGEEGRLLAIDKDKEALRAAKKRLSGFTNIKYANEDFRNGCCGLNTRYNL